MMKFSINESKRDDLLLRYMELLNSNGINVNIGQVKSKLLNKFVVEGNIHNLSLRSNFYLAGVARYYFEGLLTKNKDLSLLKPESWQGQDIQDTWDVVVCKKLDALINVLRNAYIDTVGAQMLEPEDFGELPLKDLLKKYSKEIKKELGGSTQKKSTDIQIDTNEHVGKGYTFDIMYSPQDCQKYNNATSPAAWCITYAKQHYYSYVNMLNIHYVIFRQDGWENVPRPKDPLVEPGFTPQKPHDAYGNSLIAMLQSNVSPEPVYITSRWNHGYEVHCEADHAYTKEEFQQITGVTDDDLKRIYDIWKAFKNKIKKNSANKKEENFISRSLKYLQMRINAGENPEKLFYETVHIFGSTKVNKGTFICSAKLSETTLGTNERLVYFLFDNGKIIFNTVCNDISAFNIAANIIVTITLNENKHFLYSLQHHKLLSINGVYAFRRVPPLSNYKFDINTEYYFEIKEGRYEAALFSTKTMEPLQLPNGQYWYNTIESNTRYHFGHKSNIECFVCNASPPTCFTIIYDMSSHERYFYNASEKRFFEIDVPNEIMTPSDYYLSERKSNVGYEPFLEQISSDFYGLHNKNVIPIRYGKLHSYSRANGVDFYYTDQSACQLMKNGKIMSIGGETWFNAVKGRRDSDEVILKKLDRTYLFANKDLTKYLFLDNFNFTEYDDSDDKGNKYIILSDKVKNSYTYESIIYAENSDELLISPKNSIVFDGHSQYTIPNTILDYGLKTYGSCFEFHNVSEVPEKWLKYGDVFADENFRIGYNELAQLCRKKKAIWIDSDKSIGTQDTQDTVKLNMNDVENMVNEAIRRLLKKK